jgi:hypothetical protein
LGEAVVPETQLAWEAAKLARNREGIERQALNRGERSLQVAPLWPDEEPETAA